MKRKILALFTLCLVLFSFTGFAHAESSQTEDKPQIEVKYEDIAPTSSTAESENTTTQEFYPKGSTSNTINGSIYVQKVYEVPQEYDPTSLIKSDYEEDGYLFVHSETLKNVLPSTYESRVVYFPIELETKSKDKSEILKSLDPVIDYSEEDYSGKLTLDTGSIVTEATGYSSYSYTVTSQQMHTPLDRNDPYYMSKSTKQNGVDMHLVDVDWSARSEEVIGDSLVPTSYNGDAIYQGTATGYTPNGYMTTANYIGTVSKESMGNVEYTIIYKGTLIPIIEENEIPAVPIAIVGITFSGGVFLFIFLFFVKRNIKVYNLKDEQYILIDKQRITKDNPIIDLSKLKYNVSSNSYLIMLDNSLSRSLFGRNIIVEDGSNTLTHRIAGNENYSFEVVM